MLSDRMRGYERRVPAMLRVRGEQCWRAGQVELVELDGDRAEAIVEDEGRQRVVIYDHHLGAAALFVCSCRVFQRQSACAHVWATLLDVDHRFGEFDAAAALFRAESEERDGTVLLRSTPRPARGKAPTRAAPVAEWRRRLRSVAPPSVPDTEPLPQLEYYIAPAGLEDHQGLTVLVRARLLKKNGQLGALRTASMSLRVLDCLPAADRSLLAMWDRDRQAGRHSGYGYYGYSNSGNRLAQPWLVGVDTMATVLPALAATGRAFLAPPPANGQVATALRVDIDEPFCFELCFEPPEAARGVARVSGALRRGDEVLAGEQLAGLSEHHFLFVGARVVRVESAGPPALAIELAQRGPIEVPATDADELLSMLARLPGARQFLAAALEHVPHLEPIGVLSLLLPTAASAPVAASLSYDYAGASVEAADDSPLVEEGDAVRRRSFAAERRIQEQVAATDLRQLAIGGYECDRAQVPAVVAALTAAGLRVLAQGRRLRTFRSGKGAVTSQIDWLEVEGEVQFDGQLAYLPELLRRKVTPEGFVELGDGSFGILPEHWVRRIEALRLLGGELDGQVVRLPGSQALLLDAMLEARDGDGEAFAVDKKFGRLRVQLRAFHSVAPANEPTSFCGELRPYQRQGLGWLQFLREFGLGGCLADDMGLGKTVQLLAHLAGEHAQRKRKVRPSLLVAPRSVLSNWLAEAARFAPGLRVLDFSQPDRWQTTPPDQLGQYDLVLTTYALVRADVVKFEEHGLRFHYAVLDESQVAKNAHSQTSKAVRLLRAAHRLSLTGTPVENHLGELWSLFEFLNPGMLGRMPAFRALFAKDLTSEAMGQNRDLVQRALRPVLLRRTKAQVLQDLPDKVEQTLWCDLDAPQRRRYDELRLHFRNRLLAEGGELDNQKRFVVLEALLRLRQAACHEALLDPSKRELPSAKLDVLVPRLEQLVAEGHKALVFSQFTTFLDLVEPELVRRGILFERLDGQTRDRAARVQRFQQDAECTVFLISLKAGGFGLNLTAADYVFVLDPWWNPAAEMQAIDRAHRIGQKRTVHAYRLVCRGTVEERVLELQAQKKALCEAILGNERSLLQDMTRGDLELLLR